ncbi:MAG: class I mannose-6-phosphate isomerase [Nitrososphaeria archaeon]
MVDLPMTIYYSIEEADNIIRISKEEFDSITVGIEKFIDKLVKEIQTFKEKRRRTCRIAFDGYLGIEWDRVLSKLNEASKDLKIRLRTYNFSECYDLNKLASIVEKSLSVDKTFGYVYRGKIVTVLDIKSVKNLRSKLLEDSKDADAIICFGPGSANPILRKDYDIIFYFDITRETLFNSSEKRPVYYIGDKVAVHQLMRRFYYIDGPILENHKKYILKYINWYIECNSIENLKLIPKKTYLSILSKVAEQPFRIKPLYYPVPWGGNWLKKIKNLPKEMPNSGQGCIVASENSIRINVNERILIEMPFQNLLWAYPEKILGNKVNKKFGGEFPFTYWYDDQINGGDMAIQVHADGKYLKEKFNEKIRQDESYYIVYAEEGAKTYLGLRENADVKEFYEKALKAEKEHVPFDHNMYVYSIPTKPGDYFLIPAGTVHASGRNQVVLEIDGGISAYSSGYTFHIYDYLRPDLDGSLRAIHIEHSFNVLKTYRREKWVLENLKQKPKLMRKGNGWAEYLIGERKDMYFKTCRLEFEKEIDDDTKRQFHMLTLVEGEKVLVKAENGREYILHFPDTLTVPASVGRYKIVNLGEGTAKVVKALIRL